MVYVIHLEWRVRGREKEGEKGSKKMKEDEGWWRSGGDRKRVRDGDRQ